MLTVNKGGLLVNRQIIIIAGEEYAIDADGQVFRNGYGQIVPYRHRVRPHIGLGKDRVDFEDIFTYLHKDVKTPQEALRCARIKMSWRQNRNRTERVKKANKARKVRVVRITDGRRFTSISKAADSVCCTRSALSLAIKENRPCKGHKWKVL